MEGVIFLIALALVWLIFASVQDLRKREVANWLSFSLVIFALGFRFFYSIFNSNFNFLYQGLIGLGIFFILGNMLYYGRMFAGGDAKLMIALGAILPFSENFLINLKIFLIFFLLFLFAGGFYGFVWSGILSVKHFDNFKKEFKKIFKKNKTKIYIAVCSGVILAFLGFFESIFFYLGVLIFFFSYLYLYIKAVDESCMVATISYKELSEGDWLYKDIIIGKKSIKANWEGLSKEEVQLIKKYRKNVKIRRGIPFVPVFLISFIILILSYQWVLLWNSVW